MEHEKSMTERLASDGGRPVRTEPFPPWPIFDDRMIDAVTAVLRSGRTNQWTGDRVRAFESATAEAAGTKYAVAVANGTVALQLALTALDIGPGDEVIVTPRTFIASAGAVLLCGATPVFADVDRDSQNISAQTIEPAITERTRAIITVHLAGRPCEMDPIIELADRHNLAVVEDCAQAIGARYRSLPVGSFGRAAAFSFCQDKIISTGGEGGMLVTNDEDLWRRAWSYKDHGKDPDAVAHPDPSTVFQWLHASLGTNWRMTEMQAAIGLIAAEHLPAWIKARRRNAEILDQFLRPIETIRIPEVPEEIDHAYYKYYFFIKPDRLTEGWTRDQIVRAIQAEGIPCGSGSCGEIYNEKMFDHEAGRPARRLPIAQELAETSIMLQVHPTLDEQALADTATAVRRVLQVATK